MGIGRVLIGDGFFVGRARNYRRDLKVPALADLGTTTVARIELTYVELPGLVEQTVTLPINVNVVPGDEAAARVPNPTVHSEVLFQEAQLTKKQASEAYRDGDDETGKRLLGETRASLRAALDIAPEAVSADVRRELDDVADMEEMSGKFDGAYMSKATLASYDAMTRKRGRRRDDR